MVFGKPMKCKVAHKVGPTVADMDKGHPLPIEVTGNNSCAHTCIRRFRTGRIVKNAIDTLNGPMQEFAANIFSRLPSEGLKQRIDRKTAGDLACPASSYAVADNKQSKLEIEAERVLIVLANLADIALRRGLNAYLHRYRNSYASSCAQRSHAGSS
jgi:hypothetical protein